MLSSGSWLSPGELAIILSIAQKLFLIVFRIRGIEDNDYTTYREHTKSFSKPYTNVQVQLMFLLYMKRPWFEQSILEQDIYKLKENKKHVEIVELMSSSKTGSYQMHTFADRRKVLSISS